MGKGVKTSYTRPDLKEATVLAIIKQYRRDTMATLLSFPIYILLISVLTVAVLAGFWTAERPSIDLIRVASHMGLIALIVFFWSWLRRAKRRVNSMAKILLFRPFRAKYSTLARVVISPLLSRLGDVFTVLSDGYPNAGNHDKIFAANGEHYTDKFEDSAEGGTTFGWKDAVFDRLKQSDIAVIDVSDGAAGLAWEIELANTLFPSERLIFIAHRDLLISDQSTLNQRIISRATIPYGAGLWTYLQFLRQVRQRICLAISAPRWLDIASQRQAILQALSTSHTTLPEELESNLNKVVAEFDDSPERVWWYLRQAIVEGNDNGLYWLNLRPSAEWETEAWEKITANQRYQILIDLMERTYHHPETFRHGPRAWNSRW